MPPSNDTNASQIIPSIFRFGCHCRRSGSHVAPDIPHRRDNAFSGKPMLSPCSQRLPKQANTRSSVSILQIGRAHHYPVPTIATTNPSRFADRREPLNDKSCESFPRKIVKSRTGRDCHRLSVLLQKFYSLLFPGTSFHLKSPPPPRRPA